MDFLTSLPVEAKYLSVATAGVAALYFGYRSILPKPLPGIPYNPEALLSPLGDLPNLSRTVTRTREFTAWLNSQLDRHNSPVIQLFILFPFWKPVVVVGDGREVHDILQRRTPREFDRSVIAKVILGAIAPDHHLAKLTTDPEWKYRRRLLHDLMTPAFLQGVAAGAVTDKAEDLIRLWELKARMAEGRPFSASEDMFHASLDAVLIFTFGERFTQGAIAAKVERLGRMNAAEVAAVAGEAKADGSVEFPTAEQAPFVVQTVTLLSALEHVRKSPIKSLKWWHLKRTSLKEPLVVKNKFIEDEVLSAIQRRQDQTDEQWVRSAVDHIVSREFSEAKKEDRKPKCPSNEIGDEIFGFITAGHETTSSSLSWGLKMLSDNQDSQTKLRASLQEALPLAFKERRSPTSAEIEAAHMPYLDAVAEEILRHARTIPFNSRDTLCDVDILGYRVPKGTICWLSQTQNGVLRPSPNPVDEEKRTETSRAARESGRLPLWDEADMGLFVPERWLNEDGSFNPSAGLSMAFGAGVRACYGKKLAYLELKTLLILIICRFYLEPCPVELSTYKSIDGIAHKPQTCYVKLKFFY